MERYDLQTACEEIITGTNEIMSVIDQTEIIEDMVEKAIDVQTTEGDNNYLTPVAVEMMMIPVKKLMATLQIQDSFVPGVESYTNVLTRQSATKYAIEGLVETFKHAWELILNAFSVLWEKIKRLFKHLFGRSDTHLVQSHAILDGLKNGTKVAVEDHYDGEIRDPRLGNAFSLNGKANQNTATTIMHNHISLLKSSEQALSKLVNIMNMLEHSLSSVEHKLTSASVASTVVFDYVKDAIGFDPTTIKGHSSANAGKKELFADGLVGGLSVWMTMLTDNEKLFDINIEESDSWNPSESITTMGKYEIERFVHLTIDLAHLIQGLKQSFSNTEKAFENGMKICNKMISMGNLSQTLEERQFGHVMTATRTVVKILMKQMTELMVIVPRLSDKAITIANIYSGKSANLLLTA